MTRRCRDEDDPVAGYKRANAVDDPDAQQSPARYRFPPQFLKSRLRHVRIMVEVKFNQTVIPAHQSSETRHRSAAACFQRRLLPPGIEILVLNGNGNHPPVTGGKLASSDPRVGKECVSRCKSR